MICDAHAKKWSNNGQNFFFCCFNRRISNQWEFPQAGQPIKSGGSCFGSSNSFLCSPIHLFRIVVKPKVNSIFCLWDSGVMNNYCSRKFKEFKVALLAPKILGVDTWRRVFFLDRWFLFLYSWFTKNILKIAQKFSSLRRAFATVLKDILPMKVYPSRFNKLF